MKTSDKAVVQWYFSGNPLSIQINTITQIHGRYPVRIELSNGTTRELWMPPKKVHDAIKKEIEYDLFERE